MILLRSNTAVIIAVGPFYDKTDGVTIKTALTITNEKITLVAETDAGSAPTLILDNITGATSGTSNDLNYITNGDNGMMQMELAAADVNRVGRMKLSITDAANHVPVFHELFVVPQAIYDWWTGVIVPLPANVTQLLGTAWLTPGTAGTPDVNAKLWNGLTTVALPLIPTTAGRTLDVTATGEAGIDWANIGAPTTTVDLSGTTIKTTQKVDVDTIKTNPVVNAGTITFPTTATLASTTNITAGTVTTATNVTTVNGLAANVITASSINADAITAAKIADGAIDAATFAAGAINAAAIATDAITAAKIAADAIGASELAADAVTEIQTGLATPTNITAGTITTVTNLTNAPTSGDFTATMKTSIGTAVAASAVASVTAGVTVTTNNDKTGYRLSATGVDDILDDAIGDGTITMRQALRVLIAGMAGKLSGAATTTVTIRNLADSADVVVATVDASGNRSAVTVTP